MITLLLQTVETERLGSLLMVTQLVLSWDLNIGSLAERPYLSLPCMLPLIQESKRNSFSFQESKTIFCNNIQSDFHTW